jgi:hypothetical protein
MLGVDEWILAIGAASAAVGVLIAYKSMRHGKTSTEIAQANFKAENVADLSIEVTMVAAFAEGMVLSDGENYMLDSPPAWERPIPLFLVRVKNNAKMSVTISKVGVRLVQGNAFIEFRGSDLSEGHQFPKLPLQLPGGHDVKFPVMPIELEQMLKVVKAKPEENLMVDVVDPVDRHYSSLPIKASVHLEDPMPFNVAANFHSPAIVSDIGEELELSKD